jgi:hypothetical protein
VIHPNLPPLELDGVPTPPLEVDEQGRHFYRAYGLTVGKDGLEPVEIKVVMLPPVINPKFKLTGHGPPPSPES